MKTKEGQKEAMGQGRYGITARNGWRVSIGQSTE